MNIDPINEWEDILDMNPIRNAFSAELSANIYLKSESNLFIQSGFKFHHVTNQFGWIEHVDPRIKYGVNLNYSTYFISPSYRLMLNKDMELRCGVGLLLHYAVANQEGAKLTYDQNSENWISTQYDSKYEDIDLGYNVSLVLSKSINNNLSIAVKSEYNWLYSDIGEPTPSPYNEVDLGRDNFIVPIHKGNLDLSGFSILLGVTTRIAISD